MLQGRILVVDDDLAIRNLLNKYLGANGYDIKLSESAEEALEILKAEPCDVILVDLSLSGMSGLDLLQELQVRHIKVGVLVISATSEVRDLVVAQRFGSLDFILKPFDRTALNYLKRRIEQLLEERSIELSQACRVCEHRKALTIQLDKALKEAIYMLAVAAEAKDDDTGNHVLRIQAITLELALALGFERSYAVMVAISAILHDVGKISVPDEILKKPGKLTTEEWAIMQKHTIYGEKILRRHEFYSIARKIARHHHENWDGTGYPDGLVGAAIPLPARITAIGDVWDALIHKRVYKEAWPEKKAIAEMLNLSGRKFDPDILKLFLGLVAKGRIGEVLADLAEPGKAPCGGDD